MIKDEIKKMIQQLIEGEILDFSVEPSVHSDYASNVALVLAKKVSKNPMEIAEDIKGKIEGNKIFEKVEVAKPGFLNFFISEKYLQNEINKILKEKEKYGNSNLGKKQKINIEFISANPTGPLTLGNGRGGFGGDVLSNILTKTGYKVFKEYYINDIGAQIVKLGHSVLKDSEAVYKGEYINQLKKSCKGTDPEIIGKTAGKIILEKMIKPSVKKMGIKFDNWFSETKLYKNNEVDKVIKELTKNGFTYESEGALWFKSKNLGDDKDRVLIRSDGIKTYFSSDIAYLQNKFQRGFNKIIIFLGADHYGYVARLKAACHALGYKKEDVNTIILQLVRLFENGKEIRMSKRTGTYITIDDLIDEVGLDVVRFFFLQRSLNTHFNFNMDIAKEKSEKNPIFKVQYAYARINSIFKKTKTKPKVNLELLKAKEELELIKKLVKFSEIIEDTAKDYQLQRLANYAIELAESFHKFYENCKVVSENKKITEARLSLIQATKIILKNILDLMGISAPEKMKRDETKK